MRDTRGTEITAGLDLDDVFELALSTAEPPRYQDRRETVKLILFHLNLRHWRVTYLAVGAVLGIPARSVSKLLPAGTYAGVVVRSDTGMPGDGGTYRADLAKSHIVSGAVELRALISGDWLTVRRPCA
jgi:hypothetical protein